MQSCKVQFFVFHVDQTAWHLVKVFIIHFLDCTHSYWHTGSFKVSHFSISISGSFDWLVLLYSSVDILLSVGTTISVKKACFSFISLNHIIWSIARYFSISLDSKFPEGSSSFYFCYWFWLVFILFFVVQYSIAFRYFPMNVMFYLIQFRLLLKCYQQNILTAPDRILYMGQIELLDI